MFNIHPHGVIRVMMGLVYLAEFVLFLFHLILFFFFVSLLLPPGLLMELSLHIEGPDRSSGTSWKLLDEKHQQGFLSTEV